jgi:hypothetical protein
MKNRYGDKYEFEIIDNNTMTITGELNHWRFGGREGVPGISMSDLGFADPSGGPFLEVNSKINGRYITRISLDIENDRILLHSESKSKS